ncbi:hypothetical protein [Nonomuraea sp. NPDC002799]
MSPVVVSAAPRRPGARLHHEAGRPDHEAGRPEPVDQVVSGPI